MSRVLVTGGNGFLGRFAVAALRDRGFEVHGASRRRPQGIEADDWHMVDLLEPDAATELVQKVRPTHLLHAAWTTEHARYWNDPANNDWLAATRRLTQAVAASGGERVVLTGTCAQYDWNGDEPFAETRTPRRPASIYGRAKQETEDWLAGAGLSWASGLVFLPYGPFDGPRRLVPSLLSNLLAGEEARTTKGEQVRDYVHAADCGGALAALLASPVQGAVNVGTGRGTPVAEVARTVARLAGAAELLRVGALPGEDRTRVVADTARLREEVGYIPRWELEPGLRDTVEWWRQRLRRR